MNSSHPIHCITISNIEMINLINDIIYKHPFCLFLDFKIHFYPILAKRCQNVRYSTIIFALPHLPISLIALRGSSIS